MKRLTSLAARRDLTDRECAKILGGTIAGLCEMADIPTVQNAVKWWAEQSKAWDAIAKYKQIREGGNGENI